MAKMIRGWKKDEFSTPDLIWNIKLEGTYTEKRKGVEKECKLSGTAVKLTYMYLVRCLEVYGDVFPSFDEIAKFTEQSVRNAQRCVAYLEKIGLIKKVQRFNDEGMKISNEYIIYHPAQVPGLELIEEPESEKTDVPSDRLDATSDRMDVTSYPENLDKSQNPSNDRLDVTSNRLDAPSNDNKYKYSSSDKYKNSSSVLEDPYFQKMSIAWKDCFQEDLEEWEFLQLMKLRDFDFIMKQIALIKEHHDISTIDSAYAFVSSCLKKKNGYKVPKKKRSQQQPKQPKQPEKPKLPKAQLAQDEQAAGSTMTEEELAEAKKRIAFKMKYMDEVLSARANAENTF